MITSDQLHTCIESYAKRTQIHLVISRSPRQCPKHETRNVQAKTTLLQKITWHTIDCSVSYTRRGHQCEQYFNNIPITSATHSRHRVYSISVLILGLAWHAHTMTPASRTRAKRQQRRLCQTPVHMYIRVIYSVSGLGADQSTGSLPSDMIVKQQLAFAVLRHA